MKLVTAIVKPFKLDEVKEALDRARLPGITITEVAGLRPSTRAHRGVPRRRVHGRVRPEGQHRGARRRRRRAEGVADAIVRRGPHRQDRRRQGLDLPVEHLVRIRTGELGVDAI